jgi:hypothetical protein
MHSDRRGVSANIQASYIVIHRVDLHRILLGACERTPTSSDAAPAAA